MSNSPSLLYFTLLLIIVTLSCCNRNHHPIERIETAERIIEEYPDSALTILDSVMLNSSLNDRYKNKLQLLRVQAKDKANMDIASDTIILNVRDYFIDKNEIRNVALSSYYYGRVLQEQNKNEEAIKEYMVAKDYAKNTDKNNLKALIYSSMGSVFYDQFILSEAKTHFFKAAEFFNIAENSHNEIITYNNIGNACLMNSENDSAFYYYNKGYKLAELKNDSMQMAILSQNIGVAYRQIGDYKTAIKYLSKSIKSLPEKSDNSRLLLNLAKTYYGIGELDSAKFYVEKSLSLLQEDGDVFVKTNVYKTLSNIEEKKKNYQISLKYYKDYSESLEKIVDENKNKEILELKKKYQYEQFENENNKLKIKQQNATLIFVIVLLIIILIAIYFYRKSVRNKEIALERENEIFDAEKKIFQLIEMSKSYDDKENNFRNMLLHHFDILKKAATLEKYVIGDNPQDVRLIKVFNEIVYGQATLNWDLLYKTMNEVHSGFFDRLRQKFPSLDETEFRICSLTYANFSCAEIGIIIGLSANTIQMKRSVIRKKLGIESQGNIQTFLDEQLGN